MDPHNRTGAQTRATMPGATTAMDRQLALFEMLDELKLPASILLNSHGLLRVSADIVEKIKQRGDDVLGHGRTNAEVLRGMWEEDERRVIQECVDVITKACRRQADRLDGRRRGRDECHARPPEGGGFTHLLDWPVDDQPIWMRTRSGSAPIGPLSDGAQ